MKAKFTPVDQLPPAIRNTVQGLERAKFLFETGEAVELIAAALEIPTVTVLAWARDNNWTRPAGAPPVDFSMAIRSGSQTKDVPEPLTDLVDAKLQEIEDGLPMEQNNSAKESLAVLGDLALTLPEVKEKPFEDWGKIYKKLMAAELMRIPYLVRKLTPEQFFANANRIAKLNEAAMSLLGVKDMTNVAGRSVINVGILTGESKLPPDEKTVTVTEL